MGQKVNPIGFRLRYKQRLGLNMVCKKKDYGKLLIEDYKIREYIKKI